MLGEAVVQSVPDAFYVDFSVEKTGSKGDPKMKFDLKAIRSVEHVKWKTYESIPGRKAFLNKAQTGLWSDETMLCTES